MFSEYPLSIIHIIHYCSLFLTVLFNVILASKQVLYYYLKDEKITLYFTKSRSFYFYSLNSSFTKLSHSQ